MEPTPFSHEHELVSELAILGLYDQADALIDKPAVGHDQLAEIPHRYRSESVPAAFLEGVNGILSKNNLDDVQSLDIVVMGRNPYGTLAPHVAIDSGILYMNLRHGNTVDSYTFWIDPTLPKVPIHGARDTFTIDDSSLEAGDTYAAGSGIDVTDYTAKDQPVSDTESQALREILDYLMQEWH